jgi:hypothetical protein
VLLAGEECRLRECETEREGWREGGREDEDYQKKQRL